MEAVSSALTLALRLAVGPPGQRVALTRSLGDAPGLRAGDAGTVLWTDRTIHLEMDDGPLVEVDDADAIRRLDVPARVPN